LVLQQSFHGVGIAVAFHGFGIAVAFHGVEIAAALSWVWDCSNSILGLRLQWLIDYETPPVASFAIFYYFATKSV